MVGAGPGGCAAAAAVARAGLSTIIVERRAVGREEPGETLHPGIEPALDSIEAGWTAHAASAIRHDGIWVRWPGQRPTLALYGDDERGPWYGFQVHRATFHERLLEHAARCGAHVARPCRAVKPLVKGGRVAGVITATGPLTARYVLDASGGRHWLARHLGLPITRHSPRLVARYGYRVGAGEDTRPTFSADGCGWSWTARIAADRYAWVRLQLQSGHASAPCPASLVDLPASGSTAAADVTWRSPTRVSGPGFFMVGDAAFVIDPSASHGVLRGVLSGVLAGHLVRAIAAGLDEATAQKTYRDWMARHRATDTAALSTLYARLEPRPDWL